VSKTGWMAMRCSRCGRRPRRRDLDDWNGTFRRGVLVAALCPRCQTPEEHTEALINQATLDYRTDALGRLTGRPKNQ